MTATAKQDSAKSNQAAEGAEHVPSTHLVREVHSGLPNTFVVEFAPLALFGLFAFGFGAIHCLAWNSLFPTAKERLAWRVCSATKPALSALFTGLISILYRKISGDDFTVLCGFTATLVYSIGRITLIVLAFMSLRALPADAFQTVNWNSYIPHFAA